MRKKIVRLIRTIFFPHDPDSQEVEPISEEPPYIPSLAGW